MGGAGVFGVDAEALNDDRIGRGLDAVARELAGIVGSIGTMVVCLLTNLDAAEADAAEVLRRYKGQEVVERRYGNFKGALAVTPIFLKSNRRIEALISVICLALLIFSLVQRAVRLAIPPALKLAAL
jgi:hypothetical protein